MLAETAAQEGAPCLVPNGPRTPCIGSGYLVLFLCSLHRQCHAAVTSWCLMTSSYVYRQLAELHRLFDTPDHTSEVQTDAFMSCTCALSVYEQCDLGVQQAEPCDAWQSLVISTCDINDNRPQDIIFLPVMFWDKDVQALPRFLAIGYTPYYTRRHEVEEKHLHAKLHSQLHTTCATDDAVVTAIRKGNVAEPGQSPDLCKPRHQQAGIQTKP